MKRIIFLFLLFSALLPALVFAQFGHTGASASSMMSIVADSSLLTIGAHVHQLRPREGRSLWVDSLFVATYAEFAGNVVLTTTATEQLKLGTGSDAAPELSSAGDPNSGFRFPGGDKMQLVQNGLNSHTFRPYRQTMTYSDGDTNGVWLDGTYTNFATSSTGGYLFTVRGQYMLYMSNAENRFYKSISFDADDVFSIGTYAKKAKDIFASDGVWIGNKGQSAALNIYTYNYASTQTTQDSSIKIYMENGAPKVKSFDESGIQSFPLLGENGQATNIKQATVLLTIGPVAAATDTCLNLIPAGSMVIGVTTRVTTAVTGDAGFTGFSVGDGTDADRWGANLTPTLNETSDLTDCTITSVPLYNAATSVILTQVGGSVFATGGVVRVTVHYISLTAPTG